MNQIHKYMSSAALLSALMILLAGCGSGERSREAAERAAMTYWGAVMSNQHESTWNLLAAESKEKLVKEQYLDYSRFEFEGPNADYVGSYEIESAQIDGVLAVIELRLLRVSLTGLFELYVPTELIKENDGAWRVMLPDEAIERIKNHKPTITIRVKEET